MEEVEQSMPPMKSKKSWATIRHEEEVGQWMHSKKLQTKLQNLRNKIRQKLDNK
jgi:hypothetical protein